MAKPSKPTKHGGLSQKLRKTYQEYGGSAQFGQHLLPAISDYLLEKLKLPPENLQRAKQIEAHTLRLWNMGADMSSGKPFPIERARKVIDKGLQDIHAFRERHKGKLGEKQLRELQKLENALQTEKRKLANQDSNAVISPVQFSGMTQTLFGKIFDLHRANLFDLLGGKKYLLYDLTMIRTQKAIEKARRKGRWQ